MEIDEVCSIFPMMSDDEFTDLVADIKANGQRQPIHTYQGKVIDGRNRLKACQQLGITPKIQEWDGKGSLVEFIVSLNLHRRHLNSGQRAACATEAEERLAKEATERSKAGNSLGGKRSAETRRQRAEGENPTPRLIPIEPVKSREKIPATSSPSEPRPREQAAKIFGTNDRYIQDAKAVKAAAPELHEKVKAGTVTLSQAKREVARAGKRASLEAKAAEVNGSATSIAPAWDVIEGDCLEILQGIRPGTVRLVFADPPYNIGIDYGDHHDDAMDADDFMEWSESWIRAAAATLAPDGSMWVLINDEWADVYGCLLRDVGLHRRSWIKWYESFGVNTSNNFNRCSRHLFYMVKDRARFVFNRDAVSRPSDRQVKYGDSRADPGGKVWDNVWGVNPAIPRLVENARERIPDFPTQLPLSLLLPVVGCASEPGDLVLDPFNGSGTTGEAAIRLGRRYVGIEQSPEFARLARLRLTAARKDDGAAA